MLQQPPKTDDERSRAAELQRRISSGNPYVINRFGVLELPGLPAIPLAGLIASEATRRLAADRELSPWFVKVVLLRLLPTGQQALKPFGCCLMSLRRSDALRLSSRRTK